MVRSAGRSAIRSGTRPMARWVAAGACPAAHSSSSRTSSRRAPVRARRSASSGSTSTTSAGDWLTVSRYKRIGRARQRLPVGSDVHELDAHPVGVGAVEEVQPGAAEVERGAGRRHHPAPERPDGRGHGLEVVHPEGEMGEARRFMGRRPGSPVVPGASNASSSRVTPSRRTMRERRRTPSTSMRAANSSPTSCAATSSKPRPSR